MGLSCNSAHTLMVGSEVALEPSVCLTEDYWFLFVNCWLSVKLQCCYLMSLASKCHAQ